MSTAIESFAPAGRTLPAMLEQQCRRFPERTLLVAGDTRWRYADALRTAQAMGAVLQAAGIRVGDRVALMCGNRAEFLQAFLGCAWIGAVTVPVNTAVRGATLRHILANSGARLFVAEAEGLAALRGLEDRDGLPLEHVWRIDAPQEPGTEPFPAPGDVLVDAAPVQPGDTLAILYTSGTTGLSKGVCCPHAQFYWWGRHTAALLELGDGEVLLTTLPLFHTNAMNAFFQALLTGSTLVVEKRFSASGFWAALVRHQATATYVLAGIVINAVSKSLIMVLKYFADPDNELAAMEYWEMGTFGNVTTSKVLSILPLFAMGLIGLLLLRRQIELMALGDEECRGLGVRLRLTRAAVLLLSTLLVSSVICITGLVAFAGLIAPHTARLMLRRNDSLTLLMSGLMGALVVLCADILARTLYSSELPISILTTVIGVPILVYFMCKRGGAA